MNRRSFLLGAGAALSLPVLDARAQGAQITGAGASFPNPIYQKWAEAARGAVGSVWSDCHASLTLPFGNLFGLSHYGYWLGRESGPDVVRYLLRPNNPTEQG